MSLDSLSAPPFEIVDAHHHLWDLQAVNYPWLMTKDVKRFFGDPAPIQKNYLVEDLRQDFGPIAVSKSVHIQVGAASNQHLKEAQWLQQQHDAHGLPSAIVAYCDLESPSRTAHLEALLALKSVRGIRQIIGRHPDEDKTTGTDSLVGDREWFAGLQALAEHDLSFDLQLIPDQMKAAYDIFAQLPNLRVALCHCGSPWYRDKSGWSMWQQGLNRLASLPNVYCKISGLGMFDHNWTTESLRPVFEATIEAFTAGRCMLGSNFPVDKLYTDYARLWHSYQQLSEGLTADEHRRIFGATCKEFYRL